MEIINVEFLKEDTRELLKTYRIESRNGGSRENLAYVSEVLEEYRGIILRVIKQFKSVVDVNSRDTEDELDFVEDLEYQIDELTSLLKSLDHTVGTRHVRAN